MEKQWMIYGANGYTGKLTAKAATERGLKPILAGRNQVALKALGDELGLPIRVFDLNDPAVIVEGLKDVDLVLHCAGPFSKTSQPMLDACLKTATHYLDITGEIDVFAACHLRHNEAEKAGIIVIPGTGFDVVPTDCMAATLKRALPDATSLELAFEAEGGASPGTAKTSVEGLAKGGRIRRNGQMTRVPLAYQTRTIPFKDGGRHGMTIPWGDVYTAYVSTNIPNIKVFLSVPPSTSKRLKKMRLIQPFFKWPWVQKMMKNKIDKMVSGPNDKKREQTESHVWGLVTNEAGQQVTKELVTPNGYDLTVDASLGIVEHILNSGAEIAGGYYTPSKLMGADYVTTLKKVNWVQ